MTLKGEGAANGQHVTRPTFTSNDIHNQFNQVFTNLGFSPIDTELGNRLAVCIITLLQSVNVETPLNASRLRLLVQMSSLKIALIGLGIGPAGHIFKFPLLIADNNGYEPSLAMASPPVGSLLGGDLLVEAYCQRGVFRVEQRARKA